MTTPRIMIMAAGTGGHIFPGLAVAQCLRDAGAEVTWLGTRHGMENRLVGRAGLPLDQVDITGVRGGGLLTWLGLPWRLLRAMLQTLRIMRQRKPDCVLSMGGYVAGPGGLCARLLRIGLVIHEQNAIAGLTNRHLARSANRVFTAFPCELPRAEVVGNPVRADIAALPAPDARFAGRTGRLRVLAVGGSQGALIMSRVLPKAMALLSPAQRPILVHQAGRQLAVTEAAYAELGLRHEVEVVAFIDDMAAAWAQADVAICRAGALTVSELASVGLAALLVPFAQAVDDHQTENAKHLADAGAAWLMPEPQFTPEAVAQWLTALTRDDLCQRAQAARRLAQHQAAERVAEACLAVAA